MMNQETLEIIVRKTLQCASSQATFSFQGGEPTLCGLDFFRSVVDLQSKHNQNNVHIDNCIQTNGILITPEWAEFLGNHHFLAGLSLDGPRRLHDAFRVTPQGNGTHENVGRTAALLNQYKVDYNILFVVNAITARHPDEIYDYYKNNNYRFLQFMPCIDPANNERGAQPYSLNSRDYAFFLKRFFDKWSADFLGGREVSVRYFDNLVRMVMGMPPETCSMHGSCGCQFVFEADGSVYPCDFYVTDDWKLGSIYEKSLPELYETESCRRFLATSHSAVSTCQSCKWRPICRGGCRRDRENQQTGNLEHNYYCESFREFFSYAYPRLKDIANYVRSRQTTRA